jgi:hypothetical protein
VILQPQQLARRLVEFADAAPQRLDLVGRPGLGRVAPRGLEQVEQFGRQRLDLLAPGPVYRPLPRDAHRPRQQVFLVADLPDVLEGCEDYLLKDVIAGVHVSDDRHGHRDDSQSPAQENLHGRVDGE